MNNRLKKIIGGIMLLMGIMILSNIIFTAIQKSASSNDTALMELELEEEEVENLTEKGIKSKIKAQRISFPTDDDICHHLDFNNPYSVIKQKKFPKMQTSSILKGYDKFVYCPPELV
jgi:hypothetical protein